MGGWSPFELLGIATFRLWAPRSPRRHLGAVWHLIGRVLLSGDLGDIYLVGRGYAVAAYVAFIVVHLVITVTGVRFARQAESEVAGGAPARMAPAANTA